MKAKFYMQLLMLTMIGLVFTGCDKNNEENGGGSDADYLLTISELTPTTVKINTVPKDKNKPYFVHIMTKDAYERDMDGNPENLAGYIPGLLERMADAYNMTIADLVDPKVGYGVIGDATSSFVKMPDDADLIVFAIGVNYKGKATDKGVIEALRTPAMGEGPKLTIKMTPGDAEGKDPTTKMSVFVQSQGVVNGVEAFYPTSSIAGALAQGTTYDQILDRYGDPLSQKDIDGINSPEGISYVWGPVKPDTEYTYMIRVFSSSGITTEHQDGKTTPASPASVQTASVQTFVVSAGVKQVNTGEISSGNKSLKKERIFFTDK